MHKRLMVDGKPIAEGRRWELLVLMASKPKILGLLVAFVPVLGLILSWVGYTSAFSRSGSILVAIAVVAVYINHNMAFQADSFRKYLSNTEKMSNVQDAIDGISLVPNLDESKVSKLAGLIVNTRERAQVELPKYEKIDSVVTKLEFISGSVGTLIWGFGDLPFINNLP